MPDEGDNMMKAQRAYKESKKKAFADPTHCPKCGMLTGKGHYPWCLSSFASTAGREK